MTSPALARMRRAPALITNVVLMVALWLGIAHGAPRDREDTRSTNANPMTLIDLNAIFADHSPHASFRSNTRESSALELVSQQTAPVIPSPDSDELLPVIPIQNVQQAAFRSAEGDSFTGPSATQGTWVLIAPYGWIAGIDGRIGVGDRAVDVDITPGDVISNLGSVNGALMLHTEVGKGDWGFILDANLLRASTSVTQSHSQVDVTLQQTMIEFLGMHRLIESPDFLVEGKSATIDLLAGGRFYEFGNLLTFHPFDPRLPSVPANLSATWVDLIIGGRARLPLTRSLDAFGRADIGGFGIGNSSTLAWNLIAGADWKISSCSSLIAGYRELNISKTGGVGGTAFGFNAKMYGPFMAIAFQF